ncbi:MAG: nitrous oxide reductase accessory protein NosL [Dehalococcoidia bacterium]|nr:nitrous oxide reductase accessory protein NosL [Dehalococcoidia bacterium]
MVTRRQFLIGAGTAGALGLAFVAAPALLDGEDSEADRLPSVRFGQESCAHCGMLIDDVRFVAAWIDSGDEAHFDDIGCMVGAIETAPPSASARFFVTEYETGDWIAAEDAFYVRSDGIRSPMAYGLAASATRLGADQIAEEVTGRLHRWHDLPGELREDHHS